MAKIRKRSLYYGDMPVRGANYRLDHAGTKKRSNLKTHPLHLTMEFRWEDVWFAVPLVVCPGPGNLMIIGQPPFLKVLKVEIAG